MENNAVNRKLFVQLKEFSEEKLKEYEAGDKIDSEPFVIDVNGLKSDWSLSIYPNGQTEAETGFLSVYLLPISKVNLFDTSYKFGVRSECKDFIRSTWKTTKAEWKDSNGKGNQKLISHNELCNPYRRYLVDGEVTVFCKLTIFPTKPETKHEESLSRYQYSLLKDVSNMFSHETSKDCELHLNDGKVLRCHKFILVARLPVFEAMLVTSNMSEARKSVVHIKDFDSQTMTQLLRFLYGLKVNNLRKIAHSLIYAADKYLIKELKEICVESLADNLSKENVLSTLIIAKEIRGSDSFVDECLSCIADNIQDLRKDPEWENLSHSALVEITQRLLPDFKNPRHMHEVIE